MSWGKSIIAAFILFAVFIAVLVTVCVRQDVSLVTKDYYRDELAYDEQLARMRNADELSVRPSFAVGADHALEVRFGRFADVEKGEVYLFCPADARRDQRFELKAGSSSVQRFALSSAPHGMYKARMLWTMEGREFFVEHLINL